MIKKSMSGLGAVVIGFAALVAGSLAPERATAGGAMFPAQTCAATQGFVLPDGENGITINVATGDTFTLASGVSPDMPQLVFNATTISPLPASFTVPAGVAAVTFWSGSGGSGDGFINITCALAGAATDTDVPEAASSIAAKSQADATGDGVSNNGRNRLGGGGGNQTAQNRVFVSTQNLPGAADQFGQPDWNAWIALEGRRYEGGFEGSTGDAVIGIDNLVRNDLLVGGLLAYNRTDITNGTTRSEVTSLAVGAYFAKRFQNDLFLDGFVSVARPEYQTQGTTFTSNRVAASLSVTGSYTGGRFNVTPFGKISAYREEQPAFTGTGGAVAANTITNVNLNAGAKVEPLVPWDNGILPYISLSVDAASNTTTLSGTSSFVAPRIGLGMSAALGAGFLSVDLDAGKVRADVRDIGLRATYEFAF